jgi:hypothetical protein
MGETQERERVLAHFSQRYFQCNPEALSSEGEQVGSRVVPSGHRGTHIQESLCKRHVPTPQCKMQLHVHVELSM